MKIFLTGGTGFVGSHVVNQAHAAGIEVIAQRRSAESCSRIAPERQPDWIDKPLDAITAADLAGMDAILHLAAHSPNVPYDSFERCHYWNVTAALRLFEQALEAGVKRWTIAGTYFEYGRACERYEFIPPDAPLEPSLSYPTSKAAASIALSGLARTAGASLRIARIFQVFGEGEAATRLWPLLRKAAAEGRDVPLSAGTQVRDFIDVKDVAAWFVRELLHPPEPAGKPRVYHVCTGSPQTMRAFAEHWWKRWNAPGRLLFGEVPFRAGEIMRAAGEVTPLP